ncbi:PREDICTED: pleckstrin homology domain-containing family G member 7-like [Priapulus caudatus]|uniref:Pleckstrin homology domain-containing family G member 7-like n=1 Tax=Priapulus caudatus TaxID=37621 RepID=A0ABM1EDS6_PRICU|nr:PREDICTED: pleckstrin homology domain-containing family G member 7-like [Priapulus caudatus]
MAWCSQDRRCKRLQLQDLLIAPMQHCMKLPLLLKDIKKYTENNEEKNLITDLVKQVENSLRDLDDKIKWLKDFERLQDLQKRIIWPSVLDLEPKTFIPECLKANLSKQPCERLLASPKRHLLYEGVLTLMENSNKGTELNLFLFDDMLLITKLKKSLSRKKLSTEAPFGVKNVDSPSFVVQRQPMPLDRLILKDLTAADFSSTGLKYAFVVVQTTRFGQITAVYTFQASNETMKKAWIQKLRAATDKWKYELASRFISRRKSSASSTSTTASRRSSVKSESDDSRLQPSTSVRSRGELQRASSHRLRSSVNGVIEARKWESLDGQGRLPP